MSELPRRRLLAVSGTALAGAVAGCSSDDGDENGDEASDEPEETETESATDVEGTTLGEITVDNLDDSSHTVDVIVEFDREIEDWKTESLAADSSVTLDRSWPSDPGQVRVTARLDQGEPNHVTPAKWNDPACLNLFVRINDDGELTLSGNTDGGPCGAGDADA